MNRFDRNPPRPRTVPALCFVLALALPVSSGCYRYTLVGADPLPTNAEVRARLADGELERLRLDEILEIERQTLEGRVLGNSPDTLLLLVPVLTPQDWTFRESNLNQQVAIPRGSIIELELKELNRKETGLMVGLGVAILGAIVANNLTGFFGGQTEGPGVEKEGIDFIRIPWGR